MEEMSFWDHLEELRGTLFKVILVMALFFIGFVIAMPYLFDNVILAPCRGDFVLYRWLCEFSQWFNSVTGMSILPEFCQQDFNVKVININLSTQFFTHFSTAMWLSLISAFPIILYIIWSFIKPALYDTEIRQVQGAFALGSVLFLVGVSVGYLLVFPLTLRFLITYELSSLIENQLSLNSYMDNFLMLVFAMGIVFELPMLAMLLSKIGILRRSFFAQYRRYAILVGLILAAVITPSGDPFTLMTVFLPLYLLYEFSAFLVKK